jgi:hypothetical protein
MRLELLFGSIIGGYGVPTWCTGIGIGWVWMVNIPYDGDCRLNASMVMACDMSNILLAWTIIAVCSAALLICVVTATNGCGVGVLDGLVKFVVEDIGGGCSGWGKAEVGMLFEVGLDLYLYICLSSLSGVAIVFLKNFWGVEVLVIHPAVVGVWVSLPMNEILELLASPMLLGIPNGLDLILFFSCFDDRCGVCVGCSVRCCFLVW